MPRMSVNWRRRKLIPCFLQSSRMSRFVAPVVLGAVAMAGCRGWWRLVEDGGGHLHRPPPPSSSYTTCRLDVVVQEELVRMRPQRHGIDLLGALVRDPRVDQVRREHPALEQEGVVGLQRGERFTQGPRGVLHVLALFGLEVVQIDVHRRSEEHTSE